MKWIALIPLSFLGFALLGGVNLRTNIQDTAWSSCEELGSITLNFDGNDFPYASPDEPIFFAISLERNIKLCQTLVHFNSTTSQNYPIYLSMRYEGATQGIQVVAPPDTISIVRWVKGESTIWVRLQRPTTEWLEKDGNPLPLTQPDSVAFTFGVTARNTWTRNSAPFSLGLANLEANARLDAPYTPENQWVSTLIGVDMSVSKPGPGNTELRFTCSFFSGSIAMITGPMAPSLNPDAGFPVYISFDTTIGRTFLDYPSLAFQITEQNVSLCKSQDSNLVLRNLLLYFQADPTLSGCPFRYQIEISIPDTSDFGFVIEPLTSLGMEPENFEWWGVEPQASEQWGYPVLNVQADGSPIPAYAPHYARLFQTPTGEWLSRDIRCIRDGSAFEMTLPIAKYANSDPEPVVFDLIYNLGYCARGPVLDISPFEHSQRRLPHVARPFDHLTQIYAGEFLPCAD